MGYNYIKSMVDDIKEYINENFTGEEIAERMVDRDEWEQELNDDLFCCDSVTGNASGSYTFNSWKSKEYVTDNTDLLKEALQEFCVEGEEIAERFLNDEWEYFDVTIRCYLLGQAINEALDEIEEGAEESEI